MPSSQRPFFLSSFFAAFRQQPASGSPLSTAAVAGTQQANKHTSSGAPGRGSDSDIVAAVTAAHAPSLSSANGAAPHALLAVDGTSLTSASTSTSPASAAGSTMALPNGVTASSRSIASSAAAAAAAALTASQRLHSSRSPHHHHHHHHHHNQHHPSPHGAGASAVPIPSSGTHAQQQQQQQQNSSSLQGSLSDEPYFAGGHFPGGSVTGTSAGTPTGGVAGTAADYRGGGRRGSDSSSEGFREVLGADKWYIGGRTAAGEERFFKLGVVRRIRSGDRLSLDRLSL
ncbi:hypothetical protein SEPCBS119000_001128 [Sporothrix epigloea]|uniref:Uncharacterized protein n=1 Tax=Sporothrix epigloea TaxID=1892477 RepID=A0ABP0DAN8_9PEZI